VTGSTSSSLFEERLELAAMLSEPAQVRDDCLTTGDPPVGSLKSPFALRDKFVK
jgi:hypothetical protein